MNKNLVLKKDQINTIKYFIRYEESKHRFGDFDKFKITSLRIHANGDYSFKVNYMNKYYGVKDDYFVEGNLFEEFPVNAVIDGLDAIQLLFHKIHIKAYERRLKYDKEQIKSYNDTFDYLCKIYEPSGSYNKECKIIDKNYDTKLRF